MQNNRHWTPRYARRGSSRQNADAWLKLQQSRGTLVRRVMHLTEELSICIFEGTGDVGTQLWPSAFAAACWLATATDLSGVQVVEVGAGTGLCSLTLAALGADVTATDIDKRALRLTSLAASENQLSLRTQIFDVCGPEPLPMCDLLVATDATYNDYLSEHLARRCAEALAAGGRVLVADPGRPTRAHFLRHLRASASCCEGLGFRAAADLDDFSCCWCWDADDVSRGVGAGGGYDGDGDGGGGNGDGGGVSGTDGHIWRDTTSCDAATEANTTAEGEQPRLLLMHVDPAAVIASRAWNCGEDEVAAEATVTSDH